MNNTNSDSFSYQTHVAKIFQKSHHESQECQNNFLKDDTPNWIGVAALIVFYLAVLAIGIWAGVRQKRKALEEGRSSTGEKEVLLAGRDLGIFVGIITMAATWVGGGFILGSAEMTYKEGMVWNQAPVGFSLSLWPK